MISRFSPYPQTGEGWPKGGVRAKTKTAPSWSGFVKSKNNYCTSTVNVSLSFAASASKKSFTVDLSAYQCFANQSVIGSSVVTTASCYGKLLVTSIDTNPIFITYNSVTDTISTIRLQLRIRDFNGIRSPEPPQAELTEAEWTAKTPSFWPHALYNLYNQGWQDTQIAAYKAAHSNDLPSNTKQWIYGKDTSENFDVAVLDKQDFGTSVAPRGRFILEAFYQDRATALSTVVGTTAQTPTIPAAPNINDDYDDWYGTGTGGGGE